SIKGTSPFKASPNPPFGGSPQRQNRTTFAGMGKAIRTVDCRELTAGPPATRRPPLARDMRNADKHALKNVISFGPFLLFVAEGLLERRVRVRLGRRALDILLVLVEYATKVVNKQNLVARVWPDRTVNDRSLHLHIAGLRKALGDARSGGRYVANVSG